MGWKDLEQRIVECRACPRLVAHREAVAADPPRRFRGHHYWARAVPGFGDHRARLLIVGLAPAANGANRTGRMFTGDRSGEWLYRALHETGFSNQAEQSSRSDGLKLTDAFITAICRCAPPGNKPTKEERAACRPFLMEEMELLRRVRVVVALGQVGWSGYLGTRREAGMSVPRPLPKFGHAAVAELDDGITLIGSYHPSQQNTFTGKLTQPMLRKVFEKARRLIEG